jgi:putative spermidine/putrescine transport system ATP-binding protein
MIGVSGEPTLAVEGVERRFGTVRALAGVDVDVAEGELLTILGPSGSGKTTLLHVIAGFETLDRGTIFIGGHDVTSLPPARREIGMVFQNYALFPHMTVSDNIAFPLAMRRTPRAECAERVRQVLDLVALRGLGERYPAQLSGGQQQRVALARAIVFRPKVLLLDEPFGALDRQLRESMQLEVRRLQHRLGLATIFITHDQEEALIMSNRIAIMRDGQLMQIGAPDEIYTRPTDAFVAEFVGESNLISGRIERIERGCARIAGPGGWKIMAPAGANLSEGEEIALLLRPEIPRPRDDILPCDNSFVGRITETIYLGNSHKYRLENAVGLSLLVRWPATASRPKLPVGCEIDVGWSAADGHLLRRS